MKFVGLNLDRLADAKRLFDRKGSASRSREIFKRNWRGPSLQDSSADLPHFLSLTFVLTAQPQALLPSAAVQSCPVKIFEHKRLPIAEDFHSLFLEGRVAFGQIGNGTIRAVRESQCDKNRIFVNDLMVATGNGFRVDARG